MRCAVALLAVVTAAGCTAPARSPEDFAADPKAAEEVMAACDAGRSDAECDAARRGLAEARRRARMAAYERAF